MSKVKLNPHGEALLQQYRTLRPTLDSLSQQAYELMRHALREQGMRIESLAAIESMTDTDITFRR